MGCPSFFMVILVYTVVLVALVSADHKGNSNLALMVKPKVHDIHDMDTIEVAPFVNADIDHLNTAADQIKVNLGRRIVSNPRRSSPLPNGPVHMIIPIPPSIGFLSPPSPPPPAPIS